MTDNRVNWDAEERMSVGECRFSTWFDHAAMKFRMRIDRADPQVRICDEVLNAITVEAQTHGLADLNGNVLTLRGSNQTVVYRIDWDSWEPQTDTYLAEWPD